jgi:hypothetical protein
MRYRVGRTPEALYGVKTARRRYRCDGHLTDPEDRHFIEPGSRYVASALPPHGEFGNTRWWHHRLCGDCAPADFAAEVAE